MRTGMMDDTIQTCRTGDNKVVEEYLPKAGINLIDQGADARLRRQQPGRHGYDHRADESSEWLPGPAGKSGIRLHFSFSVMNHF